ncbi:hypothetical protein VTJ49DRAFT_713 [Mycothermus thermophilus]|uniref:C3H1-type domain-containing protein n=1 Tax=Humicola insolens TaxID=85995 RepID=A0ABR3VFW5_HUMIN
MTVTTTPGFPKCYHPLPPGCCRVLELEPGNFSDPVVGRLVCHAIDDDSAEPYEAISYVWGDPTKRRDVTIDGVTLSVTENLHSALSAFRHTPSDGRVRRLWADALCINQEDLDERSSQVVLMGRIFAQASRVLSWLGWEKTEEGKDDEDAHTAISFIRHFMKDPEAGLQEARILLLHPHDEPLGCDPAAHLASLESDDERRRFRDQAAKWAAVKSFFDIEYFHRTWIVQELGVAKEAILYTARKPTSPNQPVKHEGIEWPIVGEFTRILDFRGASIVTHLSMLSWVAHHLLMVWERGPDGKPEFDFLTDMHWARILGVTDPRDRVYGLLGHPLARDPSDGQLVVRPDYTTTRGVVYTRLAARMIRLTQSLHAVGFVDHEHHPDSTAGALRRVRDLGDDACMPSWVADWHSINRTTPLWYPYPAAAEVDPEIRISGDTEGNTAGGPLPKIHARGWIVDEIVGVSHRLETADFPITQLARELGKPHPFWLDRVWEVVFPADQSSEGPGALEVLDTLSLALSHGTREPDEPPCKLSGSHQTLVEHRRSFAAYVLEYHELWLRGAEAAAGAAADTDDKHSGIRQVLPTRSLFDSLPAKVQTVIRWRAQGATSQGFLESMTWSSMCRVIYRTASGLVGMGSRITRPGDLVCRVRGAALLMTLRRVDALQAGEGEGEVEDGELPCVYIGPTVMPARLKKGAIDGLEFDADRVDPAQPYVAAFQAWEHMIRDRGRLEETLAMSYLDLLNRYREKCAECDRERRNAIMWEKEQGMTERELNGLKAVAESQAFAYVIIDGDGAVFREDLIAKGEEGGREAAHELHQRLRGYFAENNTFANIDTIFVNVILSVEGLSRALTASGVLQVTDHAALIKFSRGFCRAQPLFSVTDVGYGKEQADHKVRKMFEVMEKNIQCRCLILAGCHDNGYATFLESFRNNQKICLLETTPPAADFKKFNFKRVLFPSVFRSEPIPTRTLPPPGFTPTSPFTTVSGFTTTSSAGATAPSSATSPAAAPGASSPTNGTHNGTSATSTSPRNSVSTGRQAPSESPQPSTYASVGRSKTPLTINIASQKKSQPAPKPFYQLNRYDQRVDVPLQKPDPNAVKSLDDRRAKNGMNFCNRYHLTNNCKNTNCSFVHGERLNPAELLALRHKSRNLVCSSGHMCRDILCNLGHHCANPGSCYFGDTCRFSEMHGMDVTPTLKVYEDGTREVVNS